MYVPATGLYRYSALPKTAVRLHVNRLRSLLLNTICLPIPLLRATST